MKTIHISAATYRALAETATLPFVSTGTRQPDGTWLVPLDDETCERLDAARLPGESLDETLQRIIRIYKGQPLS